MQQNPEIGKKKGMDIKWDVCLSFEKKCDFVEKTLIFSWSQKQTSFELFTKDSTPIAYKIKN